MVNVSHRRLRPAYDNMVTDVVRWDHIQLRNVLRFRHRLTAALFLPLTWRFLVLGSQFQLYLAVEVKILFRIIYFYSLCLLHRSMPA